jgi:hypothetical protein
MDVEIGEVVSSVRVVDTVAGVAPETMQKIVAVVLKAVREDRAHERRVRAEQSVTSGVAHDQAEGH